jgi:hypothetical protein
LKQHLIIRNIKHFLSGSIKILRQISTF